MYLNFRESETAIHSHQKFATFRHRHNEIISIINLASFFLPTFSPFSRCQCQIKHTLHHTTHLSKTIFFWEGLPYRGSYALIGVKDGPALAEEVPNVNLLGMVSRPKESQKCQPCVFDGVKH